MSSLRQRLLRSTMRYIINTIRPPGGGYSANFPPNGWHGTRARCRGRALRAVRAHTHKPGGADRRPARCKGPATRIGPSRARFGNCGRSALSPRPFILICSRPPAPIPPLHCTTRQSPRAFFVCVCARTRTRARARTHAYTRVHTHARTHARTYARTHHDERARMHACMHTHSVTVFNLPVLSSNFPRYRTDRQVRRTTAFAEQDRELRDGEGRGKG